MSKDTTGRRLCALCGGSLEGHRADARFCSPVCRIEASRIRRILASGKVDGYPSLADRLRAGRRRTGRARSV